jgi:hypothetical protein
MFFYHSKLPYKTTLFQSPVTACGPKYFPQHFSDEHSQSPPLKIILVYIINFVLETVFP